MALTKLTTTQNDTLEIVITFTSNGAVVDLTGGTVVVKAHNCGTVLSTITTTSFTAPTTGVETFLFSDTDTATWPVGLIEYEVKLTTAGGAIVTKRGYIEVSEDV